jgi:hypothetical protein
MAATVVGWISATQANSKTKIVAELRRAGYSNLPDTETATSKCHVERTAATNAKHETRPSKI